MSRQGAAYIGSRKDNSGQTWREIKDGIILEALGISKDKKNGGPLKKAKTPKGAGLMKMISSREIFMNFEGMLR